MKVFNEAVQVVGGEHLPRFVLWRKRRLAIEALLDLWIARSRWWASDERREYMRLQTNRGVAEVYRRDGLWVLYRMND